MNLVQATDADFLAFHKREAPDAWLGYALKDGERIVGFGCVIWLDTGNVVAFVNRKQPVSAFMMHRAAKRVLAALKAVGETHVHCDCDNVPGAEKWLRRLGFAPMAEHPDIWRVTL